MIWCSFMIRGVQISGTGFVLGFRQSFGIAASGSLSALLSWCNLKWKRGVNESELHTIPQLYTLNYIVNVIIEHPLLQKVLWGATALSSASKSTTVEWFTLGLQNTVVNLDLGNAHFSLMRVLFARSKAATIWVWGVVLIGTCQEESN